jgi:RNA polymerase sigma-70 factor (ECF subfamily)
MDEARTSVNDLAKACSHSADAAEWEEFVRRCVPLASLVAVRVSRLWLNAPSPATVDDIVQEVFLKLCEQERRILKDFEPRGDDSFLGLLRLVSASVANDYFRRIYSAKRGGKVVITPLADGDTQWSFFWLYYRQGFTAEEIAGMSAAGLTAKGVESALRRVTLWLRGEVEPAKLEESPPPG